MRHCLLTWILFGAIGLGESDDWEIKSGNCKIDADGCATSPRWPSRYNNNRDCEIEVAPGNTKAIMVAHFSTEARYDILEVNGIAFSGDIGPENVVPSGIITWNSDYSITDEGWRLCLQETEECSEAIYGNGEQYRGCQTITMTGLTCQRWDTNSPHPTAPYNSANYPTAGLDENYCRNPGGARDTIWCYTTSSSTEWEYCNTLPLWIHLSGPCTMEASCIRSPNYPANYGNNQNCEFEVGLRGHGGVLEVVRFATEPEYDYLLMDGRRWSGSQGPEGEQVEVGWTVDWTSDRSYTMSGWEICIRLPEQTTSTTASTTSVTLTQSSSSTVTTSFTTRTFTSTTTTVIFRLLEGSFILTVSDAAAAVEDLETGPGRAALTAALGTTFGVAEEHVNLFDVSVASGGRRLSGAVTVGYELLVSATSGVSHESISTSSGQLATNVNQELSNRGVAVVVTNIQNVKKTTTTTSATMTTFTKTTSLTTKTTTSSTTTQTVTTTNTPVNCVLDDWSDWGKCDRPCSGGNRTRERPVAVPAQFGGDPCSGEVMDTAVCNTEPCSDCMAGFYLTFVSNTATNCTPCERGRYNPDPGATGPEACTPCQMGEQSSEGASFCEPCAAGSAASPILGPTAPSSLAHMSGSFESGPSGEALLNCAGTCSGIITFKASCAAARLAQFSAETRSLTGQPALLELTVGGGAPIAWNTVGSTAWQETGLSASVLIPAGDQSNVRMWASQDGLAIRSLTMHLPSTGDECGFFTEEQTWTCSLCVPGTYADGTGMTACRSCDAGSYADQVGTSRCERCKPGSFSNISGATELATCQPCQPGSYSNSSGTTACEECAPGRYHTQTSASSSASCLTCLPGESSAPGASSCEACERGRFASLAGDLCSLCSPGFFAESPGASDCLPCARGRWAAGGAEVCDDCEAGRFSSLLGAVSPENCTLCPAGTFGTALGAESEDACEGCAPGNFSSAGSTACEICSVGTVSVGNASQCDACAPGNVAETGGLSSCTSCSAGRYGLSGAACADCEPGRYSQELGATGPESCLACPAGRASAGFGATSLMRCAPCLPGQAAGEGQATCSTCPSGRYSVQTACLVCPLGQYVPYAGQTACLLCGKGTFNDDLSTPSTSCKSCPLGKFLNQEGGTAASDCVDCPAGTIGKQPGLSQCEVCSPGSVSRASGLSQCEECPALSNTPQGALACCPSSGPWLWTAGSLSLAPGKSKDEVYHLPEFAACDVAVGEPTLIPASGKNISWGAVSLATLGQGGIHSCLDIACRGQDQAHCSLRVHTGGKPNFGTGDSLTVVAEVTTYTGRQVCADRAQVTFEGFGCAENTLPYFLLALSVVVSATVLLGLIMEIVGNCRVQVLVECSFSMKLPTMWAAPKPSPGLSPSADGDVPPLPGLPSQSSTSSGKRSRVAAAPADVAEVAEEAPLPPMSEDISPGRVPSAAEHKEDVAAEDAAAEDAAVEEGAASMDIVLDDHEPVIHDWTDEKLPVSSEIDRSASGVSIKECEVVLERGSASSACHDEGRDPVEQDQETLSQASIKWPASFALRQNLVEQLEIEPSRLRHFAAWTEHEGQAPSLQVEYAVQVPKAELPSWRQRMASSHWRMAAGGPWAQASVQQQPAALVKAKGRAPGMDLLDLVERCGRALLGRRTSEDAEEAELKTLHLEVARQLLRKMTSRTARVFLGLQYFCNLLAAACLPYAGYQLMTSCDQGFPSFIHGAWLGYMCLTNLMSMILLRLLGGKLSGSFCYLFRWRLLFRALCSFILLTDTYQDATFPVIANKCNFELWFVSAWLVGLGVGLMQVVVQLLVLAYMALQYKWATTPEERDRLLVQGAFTALRGSDNLVLVYAVRPAVEERLGGASSWAMKLSEARIAFLRFIFEDVEQSALQAVFLIFYDEAAFADKLWVTTSIATSLLLSFTIVVQCIPEVRDWLWYRVLAAFPLCRVIPLLRIPWFVLAVLLYRCLSTFPWISACSPSGDPCPDNREWWEFYWGCDSNGLTTLLGLEAREKVVEDTITNSTIGVAIILSTVALASFVWWLRRLCFRNIKRQTLEKLESYNFTRRFLPGGDGALLRPVVDSDDDLWLEAARHVHQQVQAKARSEKWWAARKLHKLEYLVRSIDSGAYTLARAHLRGWSLPFYHRYLHYQMPKRLRSLVDLANSTGLDASTLTSVYQLRTNVSHALRIASVRQHVQQLLSNRHFVKAGLEKKSWWILDCPEAPPLRLIHWSKIAAAGQLPKYNVDSGGATSVEELLDEVEDRLGVGRDAAERQLVVFLLSHRWLRTAGVQKGHPDSMENIKARKLVTFAKWFMRMASAAGVQCEVAFWIDYCCCEQDDFFGADLAMAALPLYIAACTKVLVWRTPDFDRRCWTMVERLLSYSFCPGGLTPYVIDASLEELPDADDDLFPVDLPKPAPPEELWEVRVDDDQWQPFEDSAQDILRAAQLAGLPHTQVKSSGRQYEIDFKRLCQRNLDTGTRREIRLRSVARSVPVGSGAEDAAAQRAANAAKLRRSKSQGNADGVLHEAIHRMPKKLPNPLDADTCLLTRESHRRHIASLVSTALAIPAFEVFADRQPVEWGLTEVIEHSLVARRPLPSRDTEPTAGPARLMLSEGQQPSRELATTAWKLVVMDQSQRQQRQADRLSDIDVIIWVDYGESPEGLPPSPEYIDDLFARVDLAISQGLREQRDEELRALILALKADLTVALESNDEATMEAAVIRAREVELSAKREVVSCLVTSRLLAAAESGREADMRNAMRFAREKGMDHLGVYREVQTIHGALYGEALLARLSAAAVDADLAGLAAVHRTALSHGLEEVARQVIEAAEAELSRAAALGGDEAVAATAALQSSAKACGWTQIEEFAATQMLRLTMELALERSQVSDDLATMRAVEIRARKEKMDDLADKAARIVNEAAHRMGARMGLPAEWDVVERMAGTDAARLLKKDEETASELLKRIQDLVNATYWGWGGHGGRTRTRDRGTEPVAKGLQVMSVIYVQNAEVFVNYRARRSEISSGMTPDMAIGDAWDVKTMAVPLAGVGRMKENPVDPKINEHYLWHGCKPESAEGITDANFDLTRAGTAFGSLFGPGIYLAESCMKADEYTQPDRRGWYPLLLCRVVLGNVLYCDHPSPVSISSSLVAACGERGGYHSILGDREKVNGTFREFIVFDNHQVYPEYIVWYRRVF